MSCVLKRVHWAEFTPDVQLTGEPIWNPWTAMRTVSPTWALLGIVTSFGPRGAAEEPTGGQNNMSHPQHTHSTQQSNAAFEVSLFASSIYFELPWIVIGRLIGIDVNGCFM